MCLLVVAWQAHPRYPLVVAANRDEFHERPDGADGEMAATVGHPGRSRSARQRNLAGAGPAAALRSGHELPGSAEAPAARLLRAAVSFRVTWAVRRLRRLFSAPSRRRPRPTPDSTCCSRTGTRSGTAATAPTPTGRRRKPLRARPGAWGLRTVESVPGYPVAEAPACAAGIRSVARAGDRADAGAVRHARGPHPRADG